MNEEQHAILIRIDERVETLVTKAADTETRLRSLEKFRAWATGLAAALGTGIGAKFNIPH